MKKVIALILTAVMIASMFSACSADSGLDLPKDADAKTHTIYFKDFLKTDDAVATFINSDSGESEEVEMVRCGEDADSYTFSCEGDCSAYNMAYITRGGKKTGDFAFNKCVSGWYQSKDGFLPYTEGEEIDYYPELEDVTLTSGDSTKLIHIWKPDGYDADSDEKYSTVYVLDGQSMVPVINDGRRLEGCPLVTEQVRAMSSVTGRKAIVVAIESGSNRDYEMVPEIGKSEDEKRYESIHGQDSVYSEEFDGMNGTEFSDFIAETLVPYVRNHYNVYEDALHTSISGASLGGLESFYITLEHPDIFGTVGALSPSLWEFDEATWKDYLGKKSFDENSPMLYLYTGGESDMGWGTEKAYKVLKELEYPEDKLVMHYNEKGSHSSLLWCSVYSEFLTAMVYRRVEPLQQSSDAIR